MHTVEVAAGTIEYAEQGAGPTVVLLHGLLMDHTLWDQVMPLLPDGFRYIRPVLPLGSHRIPMNSNADLTLPGMATLLADFLDALDLDDVTLVHADWGGGLFLTAMGRDTRVARLIVLPCEAFDNFPPGLPGRLAVLAAKVPGGLTLAARQLRIGWLRRMPIVFGRMVTRPVSDSIMKTWTAPALENPQVRRDVCAYLHSRLIPAELIRDTQALNQFRGEALVLWSPDNTIMPPEHGRKLAALIPHSRYAEVPGAAVLSMLDDPETVAQEMSDFLIHTDDASAE